jgi:hypothetical protein
MWLCSFLALELDAGEWPTSLPSRFTPGNAPVSILWEALGASEPAWTSTESFLCGDNIKNYLETFQIMNCFELAHGRDKWRSHVARL